MTSPEQIPLPEDLEIEAPNPYRRRQKIIGIRRRGGGRLSRILKYVVLGAALPLAVWLGLRPCLRSAMSSPALLFQPVRDVQLSGNRVVALSGVLNAMGLGSAPESRPVNILHLDLAEMRRRVESIPWVESVTIERFFPHRLRVQIVERTPIAYADVAGRIKLVDQHGVFLDTRPRTAQAFPVIYGLDSASAASQRAASLAPFEQFMKETKTAARDSGWSISEVDLSDPADLRVLLVKGHTTVLAHFGSEDFGPRFNTFAAVAPQILAANAKINSMDLRFHGEVVVDPAGQSPTGESIAAPARTPGQARTQAPGPGVRISTRKPS